MTQETDFEIFLFISKNKYQIFVYDKDNSKNLYFFPSKRWDLELGNNNIIKLPNDNTNFALNLAIEFLYDNKFNDNKIIDARIKSQIILDD